MPRASRVLSSVALVALAAALAAGVATAESGEPPVLAPSGPADAPAAAAGEVEVEAWALPEVGLPEPEPRSHTCAHECQENFEQCLDDCDAWPYPGCYDDCRAIRYACFLGCF